MRLHHIESRVEQQLAIMQLIASALDRLMKVGRSNITSQRVNARLTALKEHWEQFSVQHQAIVLACCELDPDDRAHLYSHKYFADNLHALTHECFLESIEQMNSILIQEPESLPRTSSTQSMGPLTGFPNYFHHARLPRIDLPKFNGSPADWLSFKDLFSSLVLMNTSLTSVEKLQYLKTSLIGSAAPLLKNTTLTADNFQTSWDALISFYENKRLLVNSALHSLVSLKHMTRESAHELEQLYTDMMQLYRTLETLQRPVQHWDDFLVFLAVRRLDAESVKAWEHHLGPSKEPPTWAQFSDFLITRLFSLQAFEKARPGKSDSRPRPLSARLHFQGKASVTTVSKSSRCPLCSAKHYVATCPQYASKTVPQRLATISRHRLCYNCLGSHLSSECRIAKRCQKCGNKHHTTIHQVSKKPTKWEPQTAKTEPPVASTSTAAPVVNHVISSRTAPCVLLATAQVRIIAPNGEITHARALLDQGSEISLISERLTQRLHLSRQQSHIPLVGIGAQKSNRTKGIVTLTLKPHFDTNYECAITAHILPRLTTSLPSAKIDVPLWNHLQGLLLADPSFLMPGSIDVLLGADVYSQILEEGVVKGNADAPLAQRTTFGWIISGPLTPYPSSQHFRSFHISLDKKLYDLIHRFWNLEEVPSDAPSTLSADEQECELHFKSTHSRDNAGRYRVRLPFKKPVELLGDSYAKAARILTGQVRRFSSDTLYATAYSEFMRDYERLNHMRRVSNASAEPTHAYYLPHHGVMRKNHSTTKIRVVFNGSSQTTTGYSLNDLLHTGAKLQVDLFDVLIWFRQFRHVFSSDMEKMYRQIAIHPEDWDFQRILWKNQEDNLSAYQLTTVTYGLVCAPFLALRTLSQLIEDEGAKFPLAVPVLTHGRYVDDVFGGADSVPQAQEIVRQLTSLCMAGGFPLHKWISNNPDILESIPPELRVNSSTIRIDENQTVHALGLCWDPQADTFHFIVKLSLLQEVSKRAILSVIARLFDPLGFLSPVIITAKIFIQELWALKLEWDQPLPATLAHQWNTFFEQLQDIKGITVPRWIGFRSGQRMEIHGFCDASQGAMAAVAYIRTATPDGDIKINLLSAKTKVAPLKRLTIPRLELSGAVLLTKLIVHLLRILQYQNMPIFLWSDSAVTLTWINNHPSRWKDFVHNRVCYIQETLPQAVWKFISGKENPADCATRGLTPTQLSKHSPWWIGPSWLSQPSSTWPTEQHGPAAKDNLEERPAKVVTVSRDTNPALWEIASRYSSLTRLTRITATCMRALARMRRKADSILATPLTPAELRKAQLFWIHAIQHLYFRQELNVLSQGQPVPKTSSLLRLTPFLDEAGLLRIGGRLQSALIAFNAKHPFILPKESALTTLIISDAHLRTLHGGTQLTTSLIRENYWIIGGRAPIRSFILKCVRCARYRQKRAQQLMGNLPIENLTPSRPFLHSGVDYAGPFVLKTWRGKNAKTYKAYIALFVCHTTSALHLELVTDYSTDAFIAAYKRFTSRRGICATLMSDCGTNFKGADSELKTLFLSSSTEAGRLASLLANDGTSWKFNPPSAPHFGGKWEAGVKSVKFHLRRVIADTLLTYEEMNTLLTQIEATLNSRPLCPLTDDPDDLNALTPGHFLMGNAPSLIPEPSLATVKVSRLSRWQLLRQMLDTFWVRWSKECLQRYHSMYKWNRPAPSLSIGSLVLVVDERYPPSKWPLGRITQTHPGPDGRTRVVTVRTQASELKRPIVKICPLPIPQDTL